MGEIVAIPDVDPGSGRVTHAQGAVNLTLQELHNRFRMPLLAYFLRRGVGYADAEDLVQDVFTRLISRGSSAGIDRLDAYVFQTAANLLADRARRIRVRREDLDSGEGLDVSQDPLDPERIILGRESLDAAAQAFSELSERSRRIFILSRIDHMTQREVALREGVSLSTVEKTLAQVMMHIATRLEQRK